MTLTAGIRIGSYEIVALIGAGGMGEVYRARDLRLDREVAVKILPRELAGVRESAERFLREAKILAAINHPHIAQIYDLEEANGLRAIVMELIAGSTLAERVAKGPLPIREALTIAKQVAEALETAHEKRIVHRDLKPANLALTPAGSVKVLDFGLARIARPLNAAISEQPTIAASATQAGVILGTTAYMSPEQTRGQPVDERTDIWSFGCVLYEMLTGRPPFTGRTMSDTMAAVLRSEPDWTALAGKTPPRVQDLIRRCLRHDPDQRLHSIADARIELADALTQASPAARRRSWAAIAVSCAAIVVVVGMVWLWRQDRPQPAAKPDVTPFTAFVGEETAPAFSPDGTTVAFTWNQGSGSDLYVKLVGGADPLRLTTQGDVADPAWSPDGHEIAFLRRLGLSRWAVEVVPALGGATRRLATVASESGTSSYAPTGAGLAWALDGRHLIVVDQPAPEQPDALFLLSTETGEKRRLSSEQRERGDSHPAVSPDRRTVAFIRAVGNQLVRDIFVMPIAGGPAARVTSCACLITGLDWMPDGKTILFASTSAKVKGLSEVPTSGGDPISLEVGQNAQDVSIARARNRLAYSQVSDDDNIWRADGPTATQRSLPRKLIASTRQDVSPSYSPDGRRVVFWSNRSGTFALWICDSEGQSCSELTREGERPTGPARWSPDGRWIVFTHASESPGNPLVSLVQVDGGLVRTLIDDKRIRGINPSWSPDGRWIYFNLFRKDDPLGLMPIWRAPLDGGLPEPVGDAKGRRPLISEDGRFIYFVRGTPGPIWRREVTTGQDREVSSVVPVGGWTTWHGSIVYIAADAGGRKFAAQLDLATGKIDELASLGDVRLYGENVSVAPDGRWILYSQTDTNGDLMLVEGFR